MKSILEEDFLGLLRVFGEGIPLPRRQWRFCSGRRWRFDFAWPDKMVAVEAEGGVIKYGRHQRVLGFERDVEKYNMAAILGWRVLRFTRLTLDRRPQQLLEDVRMALEAVSSGSDEA